MDLKYSIGIIVFSIIAIAVGILIPFEQTHEPQLLPWEIESTPSGSTRVFGLTLGESTLQQAEHRLDTPAEISLFVAPDKKYIAEAYFDKVMLGGLSARMILVLDLQQQQLAEMYQRGARISTLGSGANKVSLQKQDEQILRNTDIASMTYLPRVRLDENMIVKRFGQAPRKINEQGNGPVHWLYPALGLDIALHQDGSAVLQYTSPGRFSELKTPLLQNDPASDPGS